MELLANHEARYIRNNSGGTFEVPPNWIVDPAGIVKYYGDAEFVVEPETKLNEEMPIPTINTYDPFSKLRA